MTAFDHTFRAAIPGMSLAHHKLGELPHEKPPKYTDPQEALNYFWSQLHRPNILKQVWSILEQGGTAWSISRAILYKSCLEGIIQINLAIGINETLIDMITILGKKKGINVKRTPKFKDATHDQMLNSKLNQTMGHKHGQQIPPSALKAMVLPKAEEVSKDAEQFIKGKPNKEPDTSTAKKAGKGLLGLGAKE